MTTTHTQRFFPLALKTREIEIARLWTLSAAAKDLGVDFDGVRALIESGEVLWAFNVGAGAGVREVRVLGECVTHPERWAHAGLEAVLDHLLPPARTSIRARDIAKQWQLSRPLILDLHRTGEIASHVNGHTRHIDAASLRRFLQRRRIV